MTTERDQGIGIEPDALLNNTHRLAKIFESQATEPEALIEILDNDLFYDHLYELASHMYVNQALDLIDTSVGTAKRKFPARNGILIRLKATRLLVLGNVANMQGVANSARVLLENPTIERFPVLHRDILNYLAEAQLYRGYPMDAIEIFQRTLAIPEPTSPNVTKQVLDSYFGLAWSYSLLGLSTEARQYLDDSLGLYEQSSAGYEEQAFFLMITRAWLSAEMDDFEAMRTDFDNVISHMLNSGMRVDRVAISFLQNLILIVSNKDLLQEADGMLARMLKTVESIMGPTYPYLAHLLETKTQLLLRQDDLAKLPSILSKIDELRSSVFPLTHPEHVYSIMNRMELYPNIIDSVNTALIGPELALKNISISIPIPNSIHAELLMHYGSLTEYNRDLVSSRKMYENLERIQTQAYGENAPGLGGTYAALAAFYQRSRDTELSNEYFRKAQKSNNSFYGAENISVSGYMLSQAENFLNQGDHEKSLRLVTEAFLLLRSSTSSALSLRIRILNSFDSLARVLEINRDIYIAMLDQTLEQSYELLGKPNQYSDGLEQKVINQLVNQNRLIEAESRGIEQINSLTAAFGAEHNRTLSAILSLTATYLSMGEYERADQFFTYLYQLKLDDPKIELALRISALKGSAFIYSAQGLHKKELYTMEQVNKLESEYYSDSSLTRQNTYKNLGTIHLKLAQWEQAYTSFSKVLDKKLAPYEILEARQHGRVVIMNNALHQKILALFKHYQSTTDAGRKAALVSEAFLIAQRLMKTEASVSVAKSSARNQSIDTDLDKLARAYENANEKNRLLNRRLLGIQDDMNSRIDSSQFEEIEIQLRANRENLDRLRDTLSKSFPEYLDLVDAESPSVNEIQSQLQENEVLLVFLELPFFKSIETMPLGLTWAISSDEVRWEESRIGSIVAESFTGLIRCGVDVSQWQSDERKAECLKHLVYKGDRIPSTDTPHLPFDLDQVQQLYIELFDPIEDFIESKDLLIVTHGALSRIPFSLLVKERPPGQFQESYSDEQTEYHRYQKTRWLIDDHTITHYPTVSSLHSLRTRATQRANETASRYLAFANPLLSGNQEHLVYGSSQKAAAQEARRLQNCKVALKPKSGLFSDLLASLFRRGDAVPIESNQLMNRESLMRLSPLPETAHEVCRTHESLNTSAEAINLGTSATESKIKAMDDTGELQSYNIVHFATHGMLAGENGAHEAGMNHSLA